MYMYMYISVVSERKEFARKILTMSNRRFANQVD